MLKKYYLAIDTTNLYASVAILDDEKIYAYKINEKPSQQSKTLFNLINSILNECNITYDNIVKILVSIGPGSFTGIRIGLSACHGIAIARNIEIIGIDNFSAFIADNTLPHRYLLRIEGGKNDYYEVEVLDNKINSEGKLVSDDKSGNIEIITCGFTDINAKSVAKAYFLAKAGNIKLHEPAPYYIRPANITKPKASHVK